MVPSSELPVSCSASLYCFRELVSDSHWIKFSLLVQVVHTRNFAARIWDRLRLDLSAAFSPCFPAPQQWRLDSVSGIVSFLFFFFFAIATRCGHLNHVYPETSRNICGADPHIFIQTGCPIYL